MIRYKPDKYQIKFIFSLKGSVFHQAVVYACPASLLALALKLWLSTYCSDSGLDEDECYGEESQLPPIFKVISNSFVYTGFTFVVGFLLVFRTSQAYTRYAEGATLLHMMRGEWYDACSNLVAFSHSPNVNSTDSEGANELRHLFVRLFSLLHSCALQEIGSLEDEEFQLIDIMGLDDKSIDYIQNLQSKRAVYKVDVVFQWIQCVMTQNLHSGLIPVPPPILTRVYQELSQGMVHFHNALKITDTPFPFPYAQMITVLLLLHCVLTPLTVVMFTYHWFWCFIFAFIPVFCFWCINFIAAEIENPFGDDVNDLPIRDMQGLMNELLIVLLDSRTSHAPTLGKKAVIDFDSLKNRKQLSFNQAFSMVKGSRKSNIAARTSLDLSEAAMNKEREREIEREDWEAAHSNQEVSEDSDSVESENTHGASNDAKPNSGEAPKAVQPSTSEENLGESPKAVQPLTSEAPPRVSPAEPVSELLAELRHELFQVKMLLLRLPPRMASHGDAWNPKISYFEQLEELSTLSKMSKDVVIHGMQILANTGNSRDDRFIGHWIEKVESQQRPAHGESQL